jgi:hypothetical protein
MNRTNSTRSAVFSLLVFLALCSGQGASAQTDWSNSSVLGSYSCSPTSCELNSGAVTSGYFYASFSGTCWPSPQAQRAQGIGSAFPLNLGINIGVGVLHGHCSVPVVVDELYDLNTIFTPYSDTSCHLYSGYITDYVLPGEAISVGGTVKWLHQQTFGCDGTVSALTVSGVLPC